MKERIAIALAISLALVLGLWVGMAAARGNGGPGVNTSSHVAHMGSGMMNGSTGSSASMMGGSSSWMQEMHGGTSVGAMREAHDAMHDSAAMQRLHDSMPADFARQCDQMHEQMDQMMGSSTASPTGAAPAGTGHAAHHSEGA